MRRRGKVDANQAEIVRALRQAGASVVSLANLGFGCPDLLVGKNGTNWLMEIKDGRGKPSERKLTPDETFFHAAWRGQICVVETVAEALACLSE
jgi:Holliday junction resolvase